MLSPFDKRIHFEIPHAQSFMLAWLREQGWKAEISSPGLIATQMLKRLSGRDGIFAIHSERLLKLLDKHSSERREQDAPEAPRAQKWIKEKTLRVEAERIVKDEGLHFGSDQFIKRLLEARVLGLGLELHCPTCLRWMWKSIDSLSAEVECDQCLSTFPIALAPHDKREWSYKPTGPFNVRGYGNGAYPVLFTWKFFTGSDRKRTTPILSFNAKKENVSCEVDLALFCEDGSWRSAGHRLILAECKAYDALKAHDIQRLESLGQKFPGSVLVFSKFSSELSPEEIHLLTKLVERQRKLRLQGKPNSSTIILTGTELFSKWGAPECWKDLADPYKKWLHVDTSSTSRSWMHQSLRRTS